LGNGFGTDQSGQSGFSSSLPSLTDPGYYSPGMGESFFGGILRGQAAVQKSAGDYNYETSAADINEQEAVRRYQDNRRQALLDYWERRRLNAEALAGQYHYPTPEEARALARVGVPKRLTSFQYEPVTGIISWPDVLRTDDFVWVRSRIDALMAQDGSKGLGSANFHAMAVATAEMEQLLHDKLNLMTPEEYVKAKNFIRSLRYEAQVTADLQGIASNR